MGDLACAYSGNRRPPDQDDRRRRSLLRDLLRRRSDPDSQRRRRDQRGLERRHVDTCHRTGTGRFDYQLGTLRDIDDLIELAKGKQLLKNEELALRLASVRAEGAALRSMTYLSVAESKTGAAPSPMTTAVRTFWGELQHKVGRLAIDVLGSDSARARNLERVLADAVLGGNSRGHQGHPEEHHRRAGAGPAEMKFVLASEQLEVGVVAAKFLSDRLPLPMVRQLADHADSGASALAVDESHLGPLRRAGVVRARGAGFPRGSGVRACRGGHALHRARPPPGAGTLCLHGNRRMARGCLRRTCPGGRDLRGGAPGRTCRRRLHLGRGAWGPGRARRSNVVRAVRDRPAGRPSKR